MRRFFLISSLMVSCALTALPNTIPGPAISDNTVLCNTNNTVCVNLTPKNSTGAVSFSGPISGGGTTITATNLADATGGPEDLKAFSSYTLSTSSSFFTQLQSNAEYWDDLTITSSSQATGSVGYLVPTMQVDGSTTASALGDAGIIWQDSVGTAAAAFDPASNCPIQPQPGACYFQGNATLTLNPIPFHYGDPFWVDFFIGAGAYPGPSFLTGTADYSHTATVTGLQVFDSNMNPVSNPTFGSAAGVHYTVNGVAPEPGSLLLIGSGLAAVGVFRYRRR